MQLDLELENVQEAPAPCNCSRVWNWNLDFESHCMLHSSSSTLLSDHKADYGVV